MSSTLTLEDQENDDVLGFWSNHSQCFPVISTIVRDIFAIPASNTMLERLFSISKDTITDKRTRLGTEKIDRLLFLRKNLNILKSLFDQNINEIDKIKRNERTINYHVNYLMKTAKKQKSMKTKIFLFRKQKILFNNTSFCIKYFYVNSLKYISSVCIFF
jgi:hypothetical protein